jgi:hypothetical protein
MACRLLWPAGECHHPDVPVSLRDHPLCLPFLLLAWARRPCSLAPLLPSPFHHPLTLQLCVCRALTSILDTSQVASVRILAMITIPSHNTTLACTFQASARAALRSHHRSPSLATLTASFAQPESGWLCLVGQSSPLRLRLRSRAFVPRDCLRLISDLPAPLCKDWDTFLSDAVIMPFPWTPATAGRTQALPLLCSLFSTPPAVMALHCNGF